LRFGSSADDFVDSLRAMLHRSSLVLPSSNLDFITYINTNLVLSQVAILGHLLILEGHRTLIRSPSWDPLKPSLKILYPEDRGGCELLQLIEHQEVTDHLVKLGRTLA
jgi:hypothetical protein